MECQDCNEENATSLIFDSVKKKFFASCEGCIKDDDFVCDDGLVVEFVKDNF